MKLITFKRESDDFSDILADKILKITHKMRMPNKLIIGIYGNDAIDTYLTLRYSNDMVNLIPDFSPKIGIDYIPQKPKNFKEPL